MSFDVKVEKLEEVAFFQEGPGILAKDFHEKGVPLLRLKSIEGPYSTLRGCNFLDPEKVRSKWSHFKTRKGDLLISTSASLGRVSIVTAETAGAIPYTGIVRFRSNSDQLLDSYLRAYLSSKEFIKQAQGMASGSVISHFGPTHIKQMTIQLPSIQKQAFIGELHTRFDENIRALKNQNSVLESIAQTLFRSWFVDFDPVHAKAAGTAPEAMSGELAELFPSEFEDSELGSIPKGWTAGRLNAICSLNPESWSTSQHPAILNYVDLSGLKKNVLLASERYSWADAPTRARRVLRKGDSMYGTVRPGNLSYGYVGANSEALTGSTGFAVLRPKGLESAEFVYCAMTLRENIERLTHLAEGAAYPAVRPDIVHEQELVLPTPEVLMAFHRVISPLFEQVTLNSRIAGDLADLRDHLLPRLISGKLRIEDAQASVAAITSGLEAEPA